MRLKRERERQAGDKKKGERERSGKGEKGEAIASRRYLEAPEVRANWVKNET